MPAPKKIKNVRPVSVTAGRSKTNYQGVDVTQKFTLVNRFLGYRNREDKTLIDPGYMIDTSQNVLIDVTGRLKSRKGYVRDGLAMSSIAPMRGWYTWEEHRGTEMAIRSFNGYAQFRYVDPVTNAVTWTNFISGMNDTNKIRFCNYWNNTELINELLCVDGSGNIYRWSGATALLASVTGTPNTITLQGTQTWRELGFYTNANMTININGFLYTYTGGFDTQTLTGVTPDPTLSGISAGMMIIQQPVTVLNSAVTGMTAAFKPSLIKNVDQQIYYGMEENNIVMVSKQNNYIDVSYSTPRLPYEGALITLFAPLKGMTIQENVMYFSAGKSQWYQVKKTLSSDNTKEVLYADPLKVAPKQGALSQETISHDADSVVLITNESRLRTLGRTLNIFGTPMMTDYSIPIANDFDNYDFTDASVTFWKTFIYIAVPKEGKFLILNQSDPTNIFWEAPQTASFAGFSIINGDLYAHGYSNPETYKMYEGYTDNGHPILSRAKFAYNNYGTRYYSRYFNKFWIDGYISTNTVLNIKYNLDLDGCATAITKQFTGESKNVCVLNSDASLGKTSFGKHGLGTNSVATVADPLPPYFAVIKQSVRKDFYHFSPEFESYGANFHWELLSFGPLVTGTMFGNNNLIED